MANLIVVCGPQAVGKMTVAENLREMKRHTEFERQILIRKRRTKT